MIFFCKKVFIKFFNECTHDCRLDNVTVEILGDVFKIEGIDFSSGVKKTLFMHSSKVYLDCQDEEK